MKILKIKFYKRPAGRGIWKAKQVAENIMSFTIEELELAKSLIEIAIKTKEANQ